MSSLLLVLAACIGQGSEGATGGELPSAVPTTTLVELEGVPARHLGREVRFRLQFRGVVEDWNPYFSRFEPGRWLALEVWPDELFLWDERVFEAPFARVFLRRGGGFEPLVRRARTAQRFEARVRVREIFHGAPWLELVELVPLEGEVGEGAILHVTRARELAREGQFRLALEQYERARSSPLPPHALAGLLEEVRVTEGERARRGKGPRRRPLREEAAQSELAARDPSLPAD